MSEKDHQKQSSDDNGWVNMVEKLTQALVDLQTQVLFMEDTLDKLDNIEKLSNSISLLNENTKCWF